MTRLPAPYLHTDPFDFVKGDVVMASIVKLGRTRRCVVRHRRSVFERATVFQISGDTRRTKRVVANLRVDAGRERSARHHRVRIRLGQGGGAEAPGATLDRAKQRPLPLSADPDAFNVRIQIGFQRVMTGHLVALATFLA